MVEIRKADDKEKYMQLLLLGDEQESMVRKYLDKGVIYVLVDGDVKGEILVTNEGNGILEIKNFAVYPCYQKRGYGKALIEYVFNKYANDYSSVVVGTGDSPLTLPFYEHQGFVKTHAIKDFFLTNYDHPIVENGVLLTDMVYLEKKLNKKNDNLLKIDYKLSLSFSVQIGVVRPTEFIIYIKYN